MRKRIKLSKNGPIKFVGHLDTLRVFQRAVLRAKLPIAYSQGFNPHQLVSFALPLSVGVTSDGEYVDIKLSCMADNEHIKNSLNNSLPNGMNVLNVIDLEEGADKAMAAVKVSNYNITHDLSLDVEELKKLVCDFMNKDEILIQKKNKKKIMKTVDIKEGIYNINILDESTINAVLSCGSQLNVKPEAVISSLYEFVNIPFDKFKIKIHRNNLYTLVNEKIVPLDEVI